MSRPITYTKHFGERYLQRVSKEKFPSLHKKIKSHIESSICVLIFECVLKGGITTVTVDGYVIPVVFVRTSLKLLVTTIYEQGSKYRD